jgi:ABC-type sugar transport system ATPase subunit
MAHGTWAFRVGSSTYEGVAVVAISDDLDELLLLSVRVLIMHGGGPVAILPPTSIDRETLLAVSTTSTLGEAA